MEVNVNNMKGRICSYNIDSFNKEVVSFGRQKDNDIVIDFNFVSRIHGVLYRDDGYYYIEDLESTNGIILNGVRIKKARISNGDRVLISDGYNRSYVELEFIIPQLQPMVNAYSTPLLYYQTSMTWYKFIIYFQLFFGHFAILL